MSTLTRPERLALILAALTERARCGSKQEMLDQMESVFDRIEDLHSGVPKDPDAASKTQSDGRMYSPHPKFELPGVRPTCYRHRAGHKTYIGENGSVRICKVNADLTEAVIFEKVGADENGFWDPD